MPLACASVTPVPARPFCFAGGPDLKLCRSLGRYTDLINGLRNEAGKSLRRKMKSKGNIVFRRRS
jgi:hypothetical protein